MRKPTSPEQLADSIVRKYFATSDGVHGIIEAAPETWNALLDSLSAPTHDAIVAIDDQLQAALSPELLNVFAKYSDLRGEDAAVRMEAAYLLGIAVARGGAR